MILGLVFDRKGKSGDEPSTITKRNLPCAPNSSIPMSLKIHQVPADDERNRAEDSHSIETECTVSSVVMVPVNLEQSDDASNGYQRGEH